MVGTFPAANTDTSRSSRSTGGVYPAGAPWPTGTANPGGGMGGAGAFTPSPSLPTPTHQRAVANPPPRAVDPLAGVVPTFFGQQYAQTQFAPQQAVLEGQLGGLNLQLGQVPVYADFDKGVLTRNAALAQQGLGIESRGNAADRNLINQQIGLQGEDYANQLRQFGLSEAQVKDLTERRIFDLRSQLTSRGAYNTVANERGTGRLNRDQAHDLAMIGTQRTGADVNNRRALASLTNSLTKNGLNAEAIGLKGKQIDQGLADGLAKIGLDSKASIDQLNNAIGSGTAQGFALAQQIFLTAIQASTMFQNLTPDQQAALLAQFGAMTPPPTPILGGVRDR